MSFSIEDTMSLADLAGLPAVITATEAARIARVHSSTMVELCDSSAFCCARVGRQWRISTADFLRWLGLEDDVKCVRDALGLGEQREAGFPDGYVPVVESVGGTTRALRSTSQEGLDRGVPHWLTPVGRDSTRC